jgi:hypothetical protein|tara:strand:- start:37 stop:363 length:327 start_codon:yes stop_codon:yes gene_type:complete
MSVKSQLEKAESAVRQALIAALAEGEDEYLTELFDALNSVRDLKKKVSNTIRFSDNTAEYYNKLDNPNFSDYSFELFTEKNGKDLDVLDNIIQFPSAMSDDDKPGLTD